MTHEAADTELRKKVLVTIVRHFRMRFAHFVVIHVRNDLVPDKSDIVGTILHRSEVPFIIVRRCPATTSEFRSSGKVFEMGGVCLTKMCNREKRTDLVGDDMGDSIQDLLFSEGGYSDRFFFEPALRVLDEFVEGWVYADEPTHNPPFYFHLRTRSPGVHA
jgi:hypothetical protein